MNSQLYLKKLKAQYEYLKAEHEYNNDVYGTAIQEFNEYFKDKINLKSEPTTQTKKQKKPILKPTVDKIYKKLAQKLHPDKKTGTEEAFQCVDNVLIPMPEHAKARKKQLLVRKRFSNNHGNTKLRC